MLILVIQKTVDIEVPGLIITMVGLKRLIHEDIHSMNSKMLKLTCFDVTFMEMFFTSKDFVVFDLPLEVFICYSVFGELIEPIFAPFTVCLVSCGRKLPYPDPLGSTASTAANHGTVISRHVQEYVFVVFVVKYTIIKSILVRTLRLSTELEGRHVDVVHGTCHVTTQKGEQ